MEEQQYKLLDGKAVSAQIKQEMAEEVARIKATGGKIPHLAAILVGHDGGSETGSNRLSFAMKAMLPKKNFFAKWTN